MLPTRSRVLDESYSLFGFSLFVCPSGEGVDQMTPEMASGFIMQQFC